MAEAFISYPVLTDEKLRDIGYVSEIPAFSYTDEYEEYPLTVEAVDEGMATYRGKVKDSRCVWYPDSHNLIITKKCRFTSAYLLFGSGGIVSQNSVIGVAVQWISTRSDERGVIPVGELKKTDSSKEFTAEYEFDKGKLKGSLQLRTILYLKKAGRATHSESFFAKRSGTILGTVDYSEIFIDGNGSVFPISTVNEPGKPLWWVYYNEFADPKQAKFDYENVDIQINQAHPNYEALKIETSMYESPLFIELLSAALVIIVQSAKESLGEDWERTLAGEDYDNGSIAEAINYFSTRLQWDMNNPSKLALSIKEFFEKNK